MFSRFDIVDAWYWYAVQFNGTALARDIWRRLDSVQYRAGHGAQHGRLEGGAAYVYCELVRREHGSEAAAQAAEDVGSDWYEEPTGQQLEARDERFHSA